MKKLIVSLLVVFVALFLLYISDNIPSISSADQKKELLKEIVKRINEEAPQTHPVTGIVMKGAMSTGNTLIYLYEVPEDWFPNENIKEELIFNFKEVNIADTYVKYKIDVSFQYFKNGSLFKAVNVNYNEFSSNVDPNL